MAIQVKLPQLPGQKLRWLVLGVAALGLAGCLWGSLTTYIGPGEVAVRQVYYGPGQGLQQEVVRPGLHLLVPGYERFHLFPRTIQLLEFNDDNLNTQRAVSLAPAINIQTSEGYRVEVDVTVAYRIVDPYRVASTVGVGTLYETALVRPRADQVLRQKLGELNAEQFYSGALRRQKAYEATQLLAKELESSGVQVWSVMVRHYRYDDRYQQAIEQRKIQDQTVFKNRAEALAAIEEAEKNRVLAQGQASIEVETQRGAAEISGIKAESDLYARKRIAEGDLLVELAKAEAKRMENDALSAAGASNVVGLKMAEALQNTQAIIVPTDGASGVNPLDLERLMRGW